MIVNSQFSNELKYNTFLQRVLFQLEHKVPTLKLGLV